MKQMMHLMMAGVLAHKVQTLIEKQDKTERVNQCMVMWVSCVYVCVLWAHEKSFRVIKC